MTKKFRIIEIPVLFVLGVALTAGCGADAPTATATALPTALPTLAPSPTPTVAKTVPQITGVELDLTEVPRYESIEMKLAVQAQYSNPYDMRQVRLDGVFTGPDGTQMTVPGFWDGQDAWRVRFTPSQVGQWSYRLVIQDEGGTSLPAQGKFDVIPSELHGWIQTGKLVDPAYSGHYLVYQDGTPFYGIGHGDASTLYSNGFDLERGFGLFDQMKKAGENYVVWWPLYTNSPLSNSYDQYSGPNMSILDLVMKDAQKKGIFLVFTIWDHSELRNSTHAWGMGRWQANGFSKLGDIKSFFTSDEAWAWQENFYRYLIARWGYSPAIGMWQTVSEINGTNAYDQTNPWHEKVNAYFAANDPYRHPTTASMSGDVDWPEGFQAMDAPQVHVYNFKNGPLEIDAVHAAQVIAYWTQLMWGRAEKPNWVGEFGVPGNVYYPELFHNSIWAALASGSAMTPAEWNNGGLWGEMTTDMNADMNRLAQFVADIPLAKLNPSVLQITVGDAASSTGAVQVRSWGVAGNDGGLLWVQDFSLEGKTIDDVRTDKTVRQGVQVSIQGLAAGTYSVHPYDTWQGKYLRAFQVTCQAGQLCVVTLPNFHADMAFRLERK